MRPIGKRPNVRAMSALAALLLTTACVSQASSAAPRFPPAAEKPAASPEDTSVIRITFLGNWVIPGENPLSPQSTLWEAALSAGGPVGTPGMIQVMRDGGLILQVNLAHKTSRQTTLEGLNVRDGDVMYHGFPPGPPNRWEQFRGGLNVTVQLLAILGSALSTYLTYTVLQDQGKI